jgi:hypothetical protein
MDQHELRNHMSKTDHGPNNVHSSKIILHTNHELKDYLINSDFRNYLSSESFHIKYNGLDSIVPYNVGFLEQITSSRDTTMLHEERLRQLLPRKAPKFQINLHRVYGADNRMSFLVMVQSKQEDVDTLIKMIKK